LRYDKKHRLVGAVVTHVIHSDDLKDDIHGIAFTKNGKNYALKIEGWEAETTVKPLR